MSLVYACLLALMSLVLVLVIPWPLFIRRHIVAAANALQASPNFKVALAFESLLVALQGLDCYNRLKRHHNFMLTESYTSEHYATKFYSQRNLYMCGAVLYLNVAFFTILLIVRKLVLKESAYRLLRSENSSKTDSAEVQKYQKLLESREKDIATLQKQIEGLQRAYDELTPDSSVDKKKD